MVLWRYRVPTLNCGLQFKMPSKGVSNYTYPGPRWKNYILLFFTPMYLFSLHTSVHSKWHFEFVMWFLRGAFMYVCLSHYIYGVTPSNRIIVKVDEKNCSLTDCLYSVIVNAEERNLIWIQWEIEDKSITIRWMVHISSHIEMFYWPANSIKRPAMTGMPVDVWKEEKNYNPFIAATSCMRFYIRWSRWSPTDTIFSENRLEWAAQKRRRQCAAHFYCWMWKHVLEE